MLAGSAAHGAYGYACRPTALPRVGAAAAGATGAPARDLVLCAGVCAPGRTGSGTLEGHGTKERIVIVHKDSQRIEFIRLDLFGSHCQM